MMTRQAAAPAQVARGRGSSSQRTANRGETGQNEPLSMDLPCLMPFDWEAHDLHLPMTQKMHRRPDKLRDGIVPSGTRG